MYICKNGVAGIILLMNAWKSHHKEALNCARDAVVPFKDNNLGLHEIENVHPC